MSVGYPGYFSWMPATRLYGAIANARFLPHCRVITLAMLYPRADLEARSREWKLKGPRTLPSEPDGDVWFEERRWSGTRMA